MHVIETNAVSWVQIDRSDSCFLRILMISGYVQLASYQMFWEQVSDLDTADKCSKVRPLMNMIQEGCKKFAMTKNVNVNESMIPYYGKFGQKLEQQMPLKPVRSGYKVWCLNLQGGYLYNSEVYQGKCSNRVC